MANYDKTPLPGVDSAWLRLDTPTNLMHITGILTFAQPIEFEKLRRRFEERILCHARFRQTVHGVGESRRHPYFQESKFRLSDHIFPVALPGPGDAQALQRYVGEWMSVPLDPTRPLWQFRYLETFDGGSAILGKIHHCIGDGMSLLQVLLGLADVSGEATATRNGVRTRPRGSMGLLRASWSTAASLGRLATLRADPPTPLRGPLGRAKRVAWSPRIPLDRFKRVGRARGATVNDVLLSTVAGALRDYLSRRGVSTEGLVLRAVVPVDLRDPGDFELGNRFGLAFVGLPVGIDDPHERLRDVKRRMDRVKNSAEAHVIFTLLRGLGSTSPKLAKWAIQLLSKNATAVMTNVPGPLDPMYLLGTRINDFFFWVPQSGRVGLGLSIFSYAGGVRLGLSTDAGLVPDPQTIVDAFGAALLAMEEAGSGVSGGE